MERFAPGSLRFARPGAARSRGRAPDCQRAETASCCRRRRNSSRRTTETMTEPLRLVPGLALGPALCASAPISSSPSQPPSSRRLLRCRLYRPLLLARRSGLFLCRGPLFVFAFLRHDRPPDPSWKCGTRRPLAGRPDCTHAPNEPPAHLAAVDGRIAAAGRRSRSAGGHGPPVAQSINSTVWTTGRSVPAAICVMQPRLPAAITSGRNLSIVPTLRSRNLLAMSGCRIL